VGQRIAKLEQSLAALLAELQALKQAHGIRGSEQVHVIQADPTGKVVSRIVKGTPEVVGLGKGPLGVTVREGRVQLDGVQLPQDLPTVQRAVRQYKLKIVDSKSKGEALRKERAALQKRLAEIEAEEQALDAIDADLAAPKPEAK
jgi:regulator of replication initiation timing